LSEDNLVRFIVDADAPTTMHSALPLPPIGAKSVQVSGEAISRACTSAVRSIMQAISAIPRQVRTARMTQVKFTLAVDAAGEVSIASLVHGRLGGSTGLEFTIQLDGEKDD